ncbi:M15 family metallopeptidase [Variovorax sp. dw_308]|uniref:M15 family metallopeptidase n=1 Tax=Variovorax sp. dw_308 TaxID=2721546 RepID=UPI001C45E092|nr:M15 family metallopeptidase [Variovorax sp. dw_308]
MSAPLFAGDVLFFQRLLRADGFYHDDLDGDWGPNTEKAARDYDAAAQQIRSQTRTFDARSEGCILTLSIAAQRRAREFLTKVLDGGVIARIISGTRTYAEQDALFRKGRFGNPGPRVTNARGGQSNHNFGVAWDIGIFTTAGGYLDDGPGYDKAAALGLPAGGGNVEWGGNWTTFVDRPHYQLALGLSVSQLRQRFEAGTLDLTPF